MCFLWGNWQGFCRLKSHLLGLPTRCQVRDVTVIIKEQKAKVKFDTTGGVLIRFPAYMWWPFRRQSDPPSVLARLEECESTIRALRTSFREIENDWELTYRKMHNALSSLNMKQRASEKAVEAAQAPPVSTNGDPMTLMEARRRVLSR